MADPLKIIDPPESARSSDRFSRREGLFLLLLCSLIILALGFVYYPSTLEDSYITFRYSEHLAEGYGFGAWNTNGDIVEGYTSFLWMLMLAVADYIGLSVLTASKALGIGSHVFLVSVLITWPRLAAKAVTNRLDIAENPNNMVLAGIFMAVYFPTAFYAASGMETVFFSAMVTCLFLSVMLRESLILMPLSTVLLTLTRPEGMLFAGAGLSYSWARRRPEGRPTRQLTAITALWIATVISLFSFRLAIFGEIVPNTYWAKAGGASLHHLSMGLRYVQLWSRPHGILFGASLAGAVLLVLSARGRRFDQWPLNGLFMLLMVAVFTVYIVKVGGDNRAAFPLWRHLLHILPVIVLFMCYTVTRVLPGSRRLQVLVVLMAVLVINMLLLDRHGGVLRKAWTDPSRNWQVLEHRDHNGYYLWLDEYTDGSTVIASSLGGELPYVVDAVHIDTLGLNTPHIARNGSFDPDGPPDSKTDMAWVIEQRPDIIEGYISAEKIIRGAPAEEIVDNWRRAMNVAMITSPAFQHEYMFILNGPYESLDRSLFMRADHWENHARKDELEAVPVALTTLALEEADHREP